MKRAKLLVALVITALLLSLVGTVAAASPADNPGKGPPDFAKVVFIHYTNDAAPAKGGIPGPPREGEYEYDGYHWADVDVLNVDSETNISGVPYYVNLGGRSADFLGGIQAAFQTWEDEPNSYIDFGYYDTTTAGMSTVGAGGYMDGLNVVGWKNLTDYYGEGVIAVNVYWYNVATKELAEFDIAMNSDSSYAWWQNSVEDEVWDFADSPGAFDVDVQNIMTHEAGHSLVLNDLYADYNSEKAMYGYSDEFELKSRSLDPGDEAGIQAIYPITTEVPTGTMHVAAIDMWYATAGPNKFIYTKVTIVDADGVAVPEATVYLEMTLPDNSTASGSGATNGDGTVTFKLKSLQTGIYTSTVKDVVKEGWTYGSAANVETSDLITVP